MLFNTRFLLRQIAVESPFIQKLLGHARLETTTIYTKVAVIRQQQVQSPLGVLTAKRHAPPDAAHRQVNAPPAL